MFTACPSGDGSISCLLGTPLPGTPPPAVLKAEVAIPEAAGTGQHVTFSLTATISAPDALALTRIRTVVVMKASTATPAPHSSRPAATPGATGTPPAARTAPPRAGTAWPAAPGTPVGGVSVVGAPVPAPGILSAQAPASGLTFPTVTPGPGLTPSPAVPGPLDGSLSAVSDRLPLSGRQIELQAGDLGLLAIALVITIARVSVRGRTLRPRRPIRSPRRVPGHPVDANACQNVTRKAASPAAGK